MYEMEQFSEHLIDFNTGCLWIHLPNLYNHFKQLECEHEPVK